MDSLILREAKALPVPDAPITTRLAVMDDLPFIDSLQKQYSKQLGFFPRAQMEGYIRGGWVVVAENEPRASASGALPDGRVSLGYCASRDRYLKRDELGAIFQLCVVPGNQRKLIGATLLKNVFERASYGTRLFCCWCAQDLVANYFWEAMGFVPLAFRTGGKVRSRQAAVGSAEPGQPTGDRRLPTGRVHIFWERRIRAGDISTPYWFPSQTNAGAVREDRIVLPIPPGTHWSEVKAMILPGNADCETRNAERKALPGAGRGSTELAEVRGRTAKPTTKLNIPGGLRPALPAEVVKEKPRRQPKPKVKIDPRMISAARELRDRWMEKVNEDPLCLETSGKYDVGRALPEMRENPTKLLAA